MGAEQGREREREREEEGWVWLEKEDRQPMLNRRIWYLSQNLI